MCKHLMVAASALSALAACSKPPAAGVPAPASESRRAGAAGAPEVKAAAQANVGKRIFDNTCIACHQENGLGITGVYPSLATSAVVLGDPKELARWVIQGQRPPAMPVGRYSTQMLAFGWLKPADAAALFTYIRSSFGNSAPAVDAATVAKALGP